MNRRSLLWSVPAVTLATAAPAFATSTVIEPEPKVCDKALGWRKLHKDNPTRATYFLKFFGCDDPKDVKMFDHSRNKWIDAVRMSPYHWSAKGFHDNRAIRNIYVDGEQFTVKFELYRGK